MNREDSFYPTLAQRDNVSIIDPLLRLKDALEGAQKNTQRMLGKLEKFEKRLGDLETKMQPIQESTEHYTRAKENISLTLTEVNKTYEYFRVANNVKEVINKGITPHNQNEYYDALVKLSYAKQFFESHRDIKSSATVLTNIDDLLLKAVAACTAEFEKLLSAVGIGCAIVDGQYQVINPMSAEVAKQAKSICDTFESSNSRGHFKIYQQCRIATCKAELKQLETSSSTLWAAQLSEDPYDKGSHPFAEYLHLSQWLLRGEFQLWGSTLPSSEESLRCFIAICDAFVADLARVLAPFVAEDKARAGINPVTRQSKLLLIRLDLLSMLNAVYDEYRDICHPDARHESTASLALQRLQQTVLAACTKSLEFLLSPSLGEGFDPKNKKEAAKLQEESSSCDLHPVTGNLLFCCKELLRSFAGQYKRMHEVATSLGLLSQASVHIPGDVEDGVSSLLENLLVALETRAEKLDESKPKALRRSLLIKNHNLFELDDKLAEELVLSARKHLFLTNNYYAMHNYLKDRREREERGGGGGGGGGGPGGSGGGPGSALQRRTSNRYQPAKQQRLLTLAEKVESRFHAELELFCETIAMALGLGVQDMSDFNTQYANDKAAQSRLLKAKFMVLNTGLEALLAQQGEWRVSSSGLREALSQQLVQRVVPTYTEFHSQYSAVRFSKKHMAEYVKHSPQQVEGHLRNFFGRSG